MSVHMFIESLYNKINFFYVLFSLFGMHVNFISVKKLLVSRDYMYRFYAVMISLILPAFHLYVFHFDEIPFLNIDISSNVPMYYTSIYLAYISALPFIIADRLYS